MSNIVSPLNNQFPLADGFRPANSGTLYIGKAGTDPTIANNQLTVTGRKSDGSTVALTQPINLNNLGQPLDGNGNTIDLLVDSHYSFATFDAYGKLQTSVSTQIIIEVDGFASLRTLPVIYEGQRVKLLGWNKGTNIGGGEFVGHKGTATDDGGVTASGSGFYWERIKFGNLTPEMFGAIGDGIADDFISIQNFLDCPVNVTRELSESKKYFNNFNDLSWTIRRPIHLECNGSLLTRKTPVAGVDNQSAVLIISNTSDVKIINCNISGNNPIGYPYNGDGTQKTSGNITSLCAAIDYGIYLLSSSNVKITGKIEKCAFNIWAKSSSNFVFEGDLNYGGQVVPNVTTSDLAYGAGIKVSDSSNFRLIVRGIGNANATVELEPQANNGYVSSWSTNNLSSGLTITNSKNIIFDAYSYNSSIGTQLVQSSKGNVTNIIGSSMSIECSWGFVLNQQSTGIDSMNTLTLNVQSKNCRGYGLYILQAGSYPIRAADINYIGENNCSSTSPSAGNDILISGDYRGLVRGRSSGCYNAVLVSGTQLSSIPPRIEIDTRETGVLDYYISPGSYADISGTKTKNTHIISAGSNFTKAHIYNLGSGGSQSQLGDFMVKSTHYYNITMPTNYSFNGEVYLALDSGQTNIYTLKIRQ